MTTPSKLRSSSWPWILGWLILSIHSVRCQAFNMKHIRHLHFLDQCSINLVVAICYSQFLKPIEIQRFRFKSSLSLLDISEWEMRDRNNRDSRSYSSLYSPWLGSMILLLRFRERIWWFIVDIILHLQSFKQLIVKLSNGMSRWWNINKRLVLMSDKVMKQRVSWDLTAWSWNGWDQKDFLLFLNKDLVGFFFTFLLIRLGWKGEWREGSVWR